MARGRKQVAASVNTPMPVEIDPGFRRIYADQAIVMYLGHDVDVALLAIGPRLERVTRGRGEGNFDRMHMRPQLNEVARIRIHPSGGAVLAMEIFRALIKAGVADKKAILEALESIEDSVHDVDGEDDDPTSESEAEPEEDVNV